MKHFCEWFDPYDEKHMEALRYYSYNGHWPKDFIPEEFKYSAQKAIGEIANKVAMAYVEHYELILPLLRIRQLNKEIKEKKGEN